MKQRIRSVVVIIICLLTVYVLPSFVSSYVFDIAFINSYIFSVLIALFILIAVIWIRTGQILDAIKLSKKTEVNIEQ